MRAVCVMFPGQGTQRAGLGKFISEHSAQARITVELATRLSGIDYVDLYSDADEETMNATVNAQPALYVHGVAAFEMVRELGIEVAFVAGHSVGEIAALHAAGVLGLDVGLEMVRQRAHLMAELGGHGCMVAVLGMDLGSLEEACTVAQASGPIVVAVRNSNVHHVCSGALVAAQKLRELVSGHRGVRTAIVRTSHPFHSPLMTGVVNEWSRFVQSVQFEPPSLPVALNVTGQMSEDVDEIRDAVIRQIDRPVLWDACIRSLHQAGAEAFVEAGESKVLSTFCRATLPTLPVFSIGDPTSLRLLKRRLPVRG